MSGPKHTPWTPGPWESAWERPDNESIRLSDHDEEWGIRAADGTVVVGTIYADGLHLAMNRENAKLIAAAPRLAAALKDALAGLEVARQHHGMNTGRLEDSARAALREAGQDDA